MQNHSLSIWMGLKPVSYTHLDVYKRQAATMTVFPVVPDYEKYPQWGRDISYTMGEPGLAGHWIKLLLHFMFIYKAKANPFWWMIPE